uniref:BPTI/Kunitz inhibitor domain-containing protein n=1 Tax=Panagrolaimus sp. PS1159 TaxID=55785 RepID=A0AC35G5J9_9BILA
MQQQPQYRPIMYPPQQPQLPQQGYYPIRTNCPTNRCNPQNRYRWRPQPMVQNNCIKCKNGPPNIRVIGPGAPNVRVITLRPGNGVNVIIGGTTELPQPSSTTYGPSTNASPQPLPIASSTNSPSSGGSATTTLPTITPVSLVTPVTPEPLQETTKSNLTSELPTPPPFTDDAAAGGGASSPIYLRPTRKPDNRFNPCPTGKPLLNSFDTPVSCNYVVQPNGGCPEDYWCHTGSTFATTACCPTNNWGNRCLLARSSGDGDALVPRWYFDVSTKQCKRFLYKGLRGNSNNFITHTQCAEECEKEKAIIDTENPCRHGLPARDPDAKRLICGPVDPSQCPKDHYCHIGENSTTTACCQGSGIEDSCLLSINVGQGRSLLKRFYYNNVAKRCIEFIYKGTKGNENNYLTYSDCKKACMRWSNPCPVLFDYGDRKDCSPLNNQCEKGEWCHIGGSKETTACCPGAISDPCKQPIEIGLGNENLTRWFADSNDKSCNRECKPFTYKGTKGNQNNFVSKEACEEKCKPECTNPCSSGELLLDPAGAPRTCGPVSPCPSNYWCHVGRTAETTVCCSAVKEPCTLGKTEGFGEAKLTRWYFSTKDRKCLSFIYHGIGGNQNNFLTSDECRTACPAFENPCGSGQPLLSSNRPKICSPSERCPGTHFCHIGTPEMDNYCCPKNGKPCEHQVSEGVGDAMIKRYYFDTDTKRCREFTYRGAKGNANNFLTQEDCEIVCPVNPNPCSTGEPLLNDKKEPLICGGADTCPSGYFCHIGGAPETTNCCPGTRRPCDLTLAIGEGLEKLERWYYDGSLQMCQQFIYKGIKGNSNNFLTREMCQEQCHELNPCLHGEPLIDAAGERMLCTGGQKLDSCPRSHYCHVGSTSLTTICCPRADGEICDQPMNEGAGGEGIPRWYFDAGSNKCQQFIYGGTKGNENNFISQQTCTEICPEHRNYCPHGQPLLDKMLNKPITCGINQECPQGFICHMSAEYTVSICCEDPSNFCLQPRETGPCNAFETRYGYHPLTDSCVPYQYGGCDGTLNNFKTLERCTEICCKEYKMEDYRIPTSP